MIKINKYDNRVFIICVVSFELSVIQNIPRINVESN